MPMSYEPPGTPCPIGEAAIIDDLVLLASEVNAAIRSLRPNGIEVTAVHNHMLDEQPRMFFMHFWAHDHAVRLAGALRAALDHINLVRE